jgi:hypothetical protein
VSHGVTEIEQHARPRLALVDGLTELVPDA